MIERVLEYELRTYILLNFGSTATDPALVTRGKPFELIFVAQGGPVINGPLVNGPFARFDLTFVAEGGLEKFR